MSRIDMTGIETRHKTGCTVKERLDCPCGPKYRTTVYLEGERITRTFDEPLDAVHFRVTAAQAKRAGTLVRPNMVPIREHMAKLIDSMEAGAVRDRSGNLYKRSTVEGYERAFNNFLDAPLGGLPAGDPGILRTLKTLIGEWRDPRRDGGALAPSSIRNVLMPLRVLYRHLIYDGVVTVNPTTGLILPAGEKTRDRIADRHEFAALLDLLEPAGDLRLSTVRTVFALAGYTGMRIGEIRGLREEMIDWDEGVIHVAGQWDNYNRAIMPTKTRQVRDIPIVAPLRRILDEHRALRDPRSPLFVTNRTGGPITPNNIQRRADLRWTKVGLQRITFHELRHSFASYCIAAQAEAGVFNPKTIQMLMGHSSIQITFDRYGHLFPKDFDQIRKTLDFYIDPED